MQNDTILKFGYPKTQLKEYRHWVVLLRPKQVTVGSLVLACKEEAESLAQVSREAYAELSEVTRELEATLRRTFRYDKINYLLLMMVDKHVHFHVIPRYRDSREVCGITFTDSHWPKPPSLMDVQEMNQQQFDELLNVLSANWINLGGD